MRVDAATRSATVPDLTNGSEYVFQMRGANALGYGGVETVRATPAIGGGGGDIVRPPTAAITVSPECAEDLSRARTGIPVTFEDASSGTVRSRLWELGDGGRSRNRRIDHAWSEPGFYSVMLTVTDGTNESLASLTFLVEASDSCRK